MRRFLILFALVSCSEPEPTGMCNRCWGPHHTPRKVNDYFVCDSHLLLEIESNTYRTAKALERLLKQEQDQ